MASASPRLSRREMQVAQRIVRGERRDQIARELGISVYTVAAYLARAYAKLGVRNPKELETALAGDLPKEGGNLAHASRSASKLGELREKLEPHELYLLSRVAAGETDARIAHRLTASGKPITSEQVARGLEQMYPKLGVKGRKAAAALYRAHN